jgi:hypothetical protein
MKNELGTCDDLKEKPLLFLPLTVVPNHQEILNIQEQCWFVMRYLRVMAPVITAWDVFIHAYELQSL